VTATGDLLDRHGQLDVLQARHQLYRGDFDLHSRKSHAHAQVRSATEGHVLCKVLAVCIKRSRTVEYRLIIVA